MNRLKLAFVVLFARDVFVSYKDYNGKTRSYVTDIVFMKKVFHSISNNLKRFKRE